MNMEILLLKTSDIVPSQDFVKLETIRKILDNWMHNDKRGLPPRPVVKKGVNGKFIAIDGHNLLVIQDLFEGECSVILVESANDFLTQELSPGSSEEAIAERNRELQEKFFLVDEMSAQMKRRGLESITDLRRSVEYLKTVERAQEFLINSFFKENDKKRGLQ